MDMTGEYRIPAPRERVWDALNDPEILKQSIAGCEQLEKVSDTEFTAQVRTKVGPVSAKFSGKVELSDIDPPNGYTISGEGQGGVAGFAKGGAKVNLTEDNGETVLKYEANATVGGKLAQIGSRLIDSTARKMADDFFRKFATAVAGPAATEAPAEAAAEAPAEVPAEQPAAEQPAAEPAAEAPAAEAPAPEAPAAEAPSPQPAAAPAGAGAGGLSPTVWIGGLIAVVVIVLIIVLA